MMSLLADWLRDEELLLPVTVGRLLEYASESDENAYKLLYCALARERPDVAELFAIELGKVDMLRRIEDEEMEEVRPEATHVLLVDVMRGSEGALAALRRNPELIEEVAIYYQPSIGRSQFYDGTRWIVDGRALRRRLRALLSECEAICGRLAVGRLVDAISAFWSSCLRPSDLPREGTFALCDWSVYHFGPRVLVRRPLAFWNVRRRSEVSIGRTVCDVLTYLAPLLDEGILGFFLDCMAAAVAGRSLKRIYVLYGPNPKSGKTTLLRVIRAMLGGACASYDRQLLECDDGNDALTLSADTRLTCVDLVDGACRLNVGTVQTLTGGGVETSVHEGRYKTRTVTLSGELVLAATALPGFRSPTVAGRICPIPLRASFESTEPFSEDLVRQLASQLLCLCVRRYYDGGGAFVLPKPVDAFKRSLLDSKDDDTLFEMRELGCRITGDEGDVVSRRSMERRARSIAGISGDFCDRIRRYVPRYDGVNFYGIAFKRRKI